MKRSTEAGGPPRNNAAVVLNSTELIEAHEREVITISSETSLQSQIVIIESGSNEPTLPYRYGRQQALNPPSLNDLNLLLNPFNVLATMALIQPDEEYSPKSPDSSHLSPISTLPMNPRTIEGWKHCTQTQMTLHFIQRTSLDEPTGIFLPRPHLTPMSTDQYLSFRDRPPDRRLHDNKRESWAWGCLFLKGGSIAARLPSNAASSYQ